MEARYCPTCGTEVDEDARFCPTCGTLLTDGDQPQLPPAPAWPEPSADAAAAQPADDTLDEPGSPEPEPEPEPPTAPAPVAPESGAPQPMAGPPSRAQPEPAAEAERQAEPDGMAAAAAQPPPPDAAQPGAADTPRRDDLPFTWPTMLSGWLIGGGAVVGALALIASLANAVSLLLFLALLGLAATIFLADHLPAVPRLRLITLGIVFVGLGVALDRAGFSAQGADSILLVAMIAAAGGVLLLELDRDRPLPPPADG